MLSKQCAICLALSFHFHMRATLFFSFTVSIKSLSGDGSFRWSWGHVILGAPALKLLYTYITSNSFVVTTINIIVIAGIVAVIVILASINFYLHTYTDFSLRQCCIVHVQFQLEPNIFYEDYHSSNSSSIALKQQVFRFPFTSMNHRASQTVPASSPCFGFVAP